MIQSGPFFWVYVHTTGIVKTVNSSLFNNLKPEHGVRPYRGWDEQNSIKWSREELQTLSFEKGWTVLSVANKDVLWICSWGEITISPQINLVLSHFSPATMHEVFRCHQANNLGCTHFHQEWGLCVTAGWDGPNHSMKGESINWLLPK